MSSEKLKPCPACGVRRDVDILPEQVMCWNCFCRGSVKASISEAIESWNAMQRPLRWTNEPPKEPGWYWNMRQGYPKEMTISWYSETRLANLYTDGKDIWAGPIPEPEE